MLEFFQKLFSSDFMPHGHCYMWQPSILWLNVISDALIAFAYYSIPVALFYFVKRREDLVFHWMFILFAIFILACGTTHVMEIWNVWSGTYRLTGVIKLFTAIASVITAILLWPLLPRAIRLPSPRQLEEANRALGHEIVERRSAEDEVRRLNDELSRRISEATRDLREALRESRRAEKRLRKLSRERATLLSREKRSREHAEAANRVKDEFLAVLSHELRTPLNAILGWAQLLQKSNRSEALLAQGLGTIERNTKAQTRIIEDLLDMSRILTGKVQIQVDRCDVNAVVSSSVATFAPAAKAKGLVLRAEGDPDAPLAWADQGRLEQVLYNLLSNAIKFTATGEVRAEVRHDASTVFLEVSDTGVGIPKEFLPHIFDRFRQADSSVTRAHGGLGLGLSIVREVVYLHGGQVKVASEEGKGTTFTVSLPRAPGEGAKQEVRDPDAPPDDGLLEGLEVLVIDDEEDSRELVRTILREHGAHVRVAASAAEGFDLLAQGATDVIVSDIGMEGQDGYSFIRDVKRGPARDTPALALTAFAHSEDRQRALQSGFDDYLSKPVDARVLVRTIQDLASHAKASDTQHFE